MTHSAIEARIPGLEGHPPLEELDPPGDPPPKPMLSPTLPEDLLLRGQKGERGQKRILGVALEFFPRHHPAQDIFVTGFTRH